MDIVCFIYCYDLITNKVNVNFFNDVVYRRLIVYALQLNSIFNIIIVKTILLIIQHNAMCPKRIQTYKNIFCILQLKR